MNQQDTDCSEVQRIVWTDGPEAASSAVLASHLETCAACREESRRAADLQAALVGLRMRMADAPPHLQAAIVEAVNRTPMDRARGIVSHPRFWRGAAVGAAAAATAVAGLIVARRLSKPEPEPSLVA